MYTVIADARDRRRLVNDDSVTRVSVTYQRYYDIIMQTGRVTKILEVLMYAYSDDDYRRQI